MPNTTGATDDVTNTGPLGDGAYTVKDGECFFSIACEHGFLCETLWNLPANAKLGAARGVPGVLLPGDQVTIPDRQIGAVPGNTTARHQFVLKAQPVKLRLVIEYEDMPLGNADYTLTVDGDVLKGTTDADGLLEVSVPPLALEGQLDLDDVSFTLHLGGLDPSSEDIGVQQRLANLDFYRGALDGDIGPVTREAISDFQSRIGLDPTGELDDNTRQQLLHRHDETHERLSSQPDPATGGSNG